MSKLSTDALRAAIGAIERLENVVRLLLASKPVRDVPETYGEAAWAKKLIDAALRPTPPTTKPAVREVLAYGNCPRCGAMNDEDARTKCLPGDDQCPMTCESDWKEALASVNANYLMTQDGSYWEQEGKIADLEYQLSRLSKPSGEAVAEDTRRLDHLAKSLHIDATGDEPIYAMFIAGVDPALRGPWDVRQLIDASILTCSSPTKEPK